MKKHILFVDDERNILESLRRLLHGQREAWHMTFVDSPLAAWDSLLARSYDAVVADISMPHMSGLELLERMQQTEQTRDVPVVILTGHGDRGLKSKALSLGAADLLNKPVDRDDLLARLKSVLRLKEYQDELRFHNSVLEEKVRERTNELALSRLDIIWRLGKAAEFRDEETGNHVIRVGCYSRTVAEALGTDEDFVETLYLAAPLHDIGKIGIEDAILRKPGKLSDDEWDVMRQHCAIGAAILQDGCKLMTAFAKWGGLRWYSGQADLDNPFLTLASSVALSHHEKWDGSGYPQGLAKNDIPLEARIVAIADVYDALRSERPYKPSFSEEKSLAILNDGVGKHFDPDVYAAFAASLETIRDIDADFSDVEESEISVEVGDDQYSLC